MIIKEALPLSRVMIVSPAEHQDRVTLLLSLFNQSSCYFMYHDLIVRLYKYRHLCGNNVASKLVIQIELTQYGFIITK